MQLPTKPRHAHLDSVALQDLRSSFQDDAADSRVDTAQLVRTHRLLARDVLLGLLRATHLMTDDHDSPITHNGRAEWAALGCGFIAAALIVVAILIGLVT